MIIFARSPLYVHSSPLTLTSQRKKIYHFNILVNFPQFFVFFDFFHFLVLVLDVHDNWKYFISSISDWILILQESIIFLFIFCKFSLNSISAVVFLNKCYHSNILDLHKMFIEIQIRIPYLLVILFLYIWSSNNFIRFS